MSTYSLARGPRGLLGAWETEGRIRYALVEHEEAPRTASGEAKACKHPSIASNAAGDVLVAWIEGMGWATGGTLAWQLFGADSAPIEGAGGRREGVPKWSLVQAVALADGSFRILY
jgi:hypothetical protein